MTPTTTAIASGQAVRTTNLREPRLGRVHRVLGPRAVVTFVRRRNKSVVRVENLEPITEAELVEHFHREESDTDPYFEPTSGENRRFLLGAAAQGNGCS